jgi:hypothetical protein
MPATYTADQCADMAGVSEWCWRQAERNGTCPVPAIRVGRRMVWSKAAVDALFGLESPGNGPDE